jgi:predicted ribosome quality control (RQC) complex YloA/Tae2 family protein
VDATETVRARLAVARASLATERRRLKRLIERLQADAATANEAPRLREQAEVLKHNLRAVPRGATRIALRVPWLPETTTEVELRPEETPQAAMERLFRRARGFERGARIIAERMAEAGQRREAVNELSRRIDALLASAQTLDAAAVDPIAQAELLRDAVAALRLRVEVRPSPPPALAKTLRQAGGELPSGVQSFVSPDGRSVLAGRNAQANDVLVVRLLRGRDLWFHVRDQAGTHVVLRCEKSDEHTDHDAAACAVLAAHLSGIARGESADVTVALGKHVRKAKGLVPGLVYVSASRTLRVRVDGNVIDAFYARRPP